MGEPGSHKGAQPAQTQLLVRVDAEIQRRGLSYPAAAELIGVNVNTLRKHLSGEHVRSDSALKYQDWLDGRVDGPRVLFLDSRSGELSRDAQRSAATELPPPPAKPRLVADIFSGCGGLSLGFDVLDGGRQFRTVIALDSEQAPITILNANSSSKGERGVGRRVDLTDFMNEAEFLTFYVEHVCALFGDREALAALNGVADGAFPRFRAQVVQADVKFLNELAAVRSSRAWQAAFAELDREALGQTSVAAFHSRLRLPRTGTKPPQLPNILWGGQTSQAEDGRGLPNLDENLKIEAEREWTSEVETLAAKRDASGRGQLNASARRVNSFVSLLTSPVFSGVRDAWVRWRTTRLMLRAALFTDATFCDGVRNLYDASYPISVLVGGPPCQGFSRIGRGKIRSLREAMVHVHGSAEAGDARNLLFLQYVMILGALRPAVFLFENVQHFQSTVPAEEGDFQATEVLEEAVANMSDGQASYAVSSVVLNAARHGVPQNRLRYFMCGIRATGLEAGPARELAASCLLVPELSEVPLRAALAGLPEPAAVLGDQNSHEAMRRPVRVQSGGEAGSAEHAFEAWLRQPPPGKTRPPAMVDAHAARVARTDDMRFFALLGPGRRWMDYRADDATTTAELSDVFRGLLAVPPSQYEKLRSASQQAGGTLPDRAVLEELAERIDGSLSLRLLLEQIGSELGYRHHLLKDSYLTKRDGSHGDWLTRLDAERPAKTMVSHMAKDTYGFVHPYSARTLSVREAARIQSFPDWFSLGDAALTEAFKMIGNAVPPLLSHAIAARVSAIIHQVECGCAVAEEIAREAAAR